MLRDDFTQEGFVVRGECTAAHGVRVGNRSRYCRLRERPVAGLGALLLIYYRRASSWVSEMKNRPVGRPASTPSRLTSLPAASRAQDTIAERLAREGMHPQRRLQYRRAHVRGHRARPRSSASPITKRASSTACRTRYSTGTTTARAVSRSPRSPHPGRAAHAATESFKPRRGDGEARRAQAPAPRRQASAAGLSERFERLDQTGSSLAIGGIHIAEGQHLRDRIGHVAPQQSNRAAALIHKSHLD
jgi:hypothetical protein